MVIYVEASTIHTAMDEREAKAVPSTMVMTINLFGICRGE